MSEEEGGGLVQLVRPRGDTGPERSLPDLEAGAAQRSDHLADGGPHPPGHPYQPAPGGGHGQVDALGGSGRPVVEGGVGHVHPSQAAEHALVFEEGLEDTLGDLGLIGRVRGDQLAPPGQGPHRRGDLVLVGPSAGETHQGAVARTVATGHLGQMAEDVGLGPAGRQLEAAGQPHCGRDVGEQVLQACQPEEVEHGPNLGLGVRNEIGHSLSPLPVSVPGVSQPREGYPSVAACQSHPAPNRWHAASHRAFRRPGDRE
jgi:hypothetical protein